MKGARTTVMRLCIVANACACGVATVARDKPTWTGVAAAFVINVLLVWAFDPWVREGRQE